MASQTQPILIAVGGSGQHVLLAYLRLARLCNFAPARLITIDADMRQGNGGIPTTAALIKRQTEVGFREPTEWESIHPLPEINDPAAQLFESQVRPATGVETELFEALFTERQRQVKVVTGFHGHPAVAASTFRMFLSEGASQLRNLFEWIDPRGETRIVIAGSTFGGTGSGVIPVLTSYLKAWCREKGRKVKLGGVIQVRWFDLDLADNPGVERTLRADVTSHDLERNSSCLVEHYRSRLESMFDTAFLIGHDPHAHRKSAGVEQQPEHPHAVNLLAGYKAYQLLHEEIAPNLSGLQGVATPDGALEDHLYFPFGSGPKGQGPRRQPLRWHIAATNAEVALGQMVLNVLNAGRPHRLEVIEPYPSFFHELVSLSEGEFGLPDGSRREPASTWGEFLEMQREALRWLAQLKDHSYDIEACQFAEELVPLSKSVGQLGAHESHLQAPLHQAFHSVLGSVRPARLGEEPETIVRRSFFEVRKRLETFLERRKRDTP